ncbi:rcc01693 family protein [Parvibaculum sp.]|uniref:rcc01693 family protein n=1 Tax=Parvibaculum sp. TaxID=2024848 RepID=UPI003918B275
MSVPRFPWDEAMSLGLGQLRLTPETFWRMTLPELAAAARALRPAHAVPIRQADFAALVARYPD